jgi:hypothetical protein
MSPQEALLQKLILSGIKKLQPHGDIFISQACNGVKSFIPSLCRLELSTNTPRNGAGGDSKGMQTFLRERLTRFAKLRPHLHLVVAHRSGKPKVEAHFNNSSTLKFEVSRWDSIKIEKLLLRLVIDIDIRPTLVER